jgi:hypothetical protein
MNVVLPREKGALEVDARVPNFCEGCMIIGGKMAIEYENGTHASLNTDAYLHHGIMVDFSKPGMLMACPSAKVVKPPPIASFIAGGASDDGFTMFGDATGKVNAGFVVGKNDRLAISAQIMNYSPEAKTIYLTAEIEYVNGKPLGYLGSHSVPLTVGSCAKSQFDLPSKKYSKVSEKAFVVPTDGYILNFSKSKICCEKKCLHIQRVIFMMVDRV